MEGPFSDEIADDIEATCEHIVHGISTADLKSILLPPVAAFVADGVRRHDALGGGSLQAGSFRSAFCVWHAIVAIFPEHHADGDCAFLATKLFDVNWTTDGARQSVFDDIERNVRHAINYVVRCRQASVGASAGHSIRQPAVRWVEALLQSQDAPDSLRILALTLALLLGAGQEVMDESISAVPRSDLVQVFLRGLNLFGLSDALVTSTLLSMITGDGGDSLAGTAKKKHFIRGSDFYRVDLDVLIDMLRTMDHNLFSKQITSADRSTTNSPNDSREYRHLLMQLAAVRAAEEQLQADVAPGESSSVEEVSTWFSTLHLSRDYSERLRFEGVDGAVLWSDLSSADVVEMGVDASGDVERILSILKRRR